MKLHLVVDAFTATSWEKMAESFASANLYQSWHYGDWHSRGLARHVSRAALLRGDRAVAMSQFRIKRVPLLGIGVAEAEWGPLFRVDEDFVPAINGFLAGIQQVYVREKGLELRLSPRSTLSEEKDRQIALLLRENGFRHNEAVRPYKTVILDLSRDLSAIRKAFDQKWRNQLNVAEKSGLTLQAGNSPEMFECFYRLYQEMWAKKRFPTGVRVPLIRKMQQDLPIDQRMYIAIAKLGSEDVGATVCAFCGDTFLYFLGATSPQLRQNCRPGYLLQWSHITAAKKKGLRWYDTGGIQDDASDITRFKTRMNGAIVQFLGRFELPSQAEPSWVYTFAEKSYRSLRRITTGS